MLAAVAAAPAAAQSEGPYQVAFMAGQVGIPFYTSMECGARTAATASNVDLNWQGPTDWDMSKQCPSSRQPPSCSPRAGSTSPTDGTTLIPIISEQMAAGTPVVTVDAPLDEPVELQSIQSNQLQPLPVGRRPPRPWSTSPEGPAPTCPSA